MKARLRSTVAAALLLPAAATFVALPTGAIAARVAPATEILTLQVNSDEGLSRGADLQFAVEATPRGKVSVTFSRITVALKETSAGMYRGTYTVRSKDRIDPTQAIVARLSRGRSSATHNFTWPASFMQLAMGNGPAPAVAAAPPPMRVEGFRMWPRERIEPGRELHFVVQAQPGAAATLDIPGVTSGVALREVAPGRYEGTYTVRQRDDLNAFDNAVATLRAGTQTVTARLAVPRDNEPPTIVGMTPRPGEVISRMGDATVSAQFDDHGGRGVDPSTVRIVISGRDVTRQARITPREFSFRDDLPPGRYTADVSARDFAGNAVNKSWNFEVGGGRNYGDNRDNAPLVLNVTTPVPNATIDANGNLSIQGRTSPFARVTARVEAITPAFGNRVSVAQPVMNETVQADREGFFSLNVQPRALPIPGTRYEVSLTANLNSQTAQQRLTVYQRQG